jgi:hypothetical protein
MRGRTVGCSLCGLANASLRVVTITHKDVNYKVEAASLLLTGVSLNLGRTWRSEQVRCSFHRLLFPKIEPGPSAELLELVARELKAHGHEKEADKALQQAAKLQQQADSDRRDFDRGRHGPPGSR